MADIQLCTEENHQLHMRITHVLPHDLFSSFFLIQPFFHSLFVHSRKGLIHHCIHGSAGVAIFIMVSLCKQIFPTETRFLESDPTIPPFHLPPLPAFCLSAVKENKAPIIDHKLASETDRGTTCHYYFS